jgi:hypothetical protein
LNNDIDFLKGKSVNVAMQAWGKPDSVKKADASHQYVWHMNAPAGVYFLGKNGQSNTIGGVTAPEKGLALTPTNSGDTCTMTVETDLNDIVLRGKYSGVQFACQMFIFNPVPNTTMQF